MALFGFIIQPVCALLLVAQLGVFFSLFRETKLLNFSSNGFSMEKKNSTYYSFYVNITYDDENATYTDTSKSPSNEAGVGDLSSRINSQIDPVVIAAKELYEKNPDKPFIIVMEASFGMVAMIKSWLCNTESMEGVHENTMIIVDDKGYKAMQNFKSRATIVKDSLPKQLQGSWSFGTLGYWRTTQHRVHTIGRILKQGVSLMLIEPDATWVQNIFEDPDLVGDMNDDLVGMNDEKDGIGFGWLRIKASKQVNKLWDYVEKNVDREMGGRELIKKGEDLSRRKDKRGDQHWLDREMKRKAKAGTLKYRILSECRYPNGRWYDGGARYNGNTNSRSKQFRWRCRKSEPRGLMVIQNNWIAGNEKKIRRAKRWQHWFLDINETGCRKEQLAKARASCETGIPPHGEVGKTTWSQSSKMQ